MERVQCLEVSHSYDGERPALAALNLEVRRGEVLALIGPNGAGKSTTLRILATLQRPDRGTVLWDGADAWPQRHALRPRIGFLGDGTALYPDMTARAYLRFFAECYGERVRNGDARVEEVLARFELGAKADRRVRELSKGMRQRLAIARTLVHEPELLLLDEPADGLDPLARRQLRDILRAVAAGGVAVVVSSHILRELDGFVDTVAVLQRGRLEVHGSVEEVIADYEVGRRIYELAILRGLGVALDILARHAGLVERITGWRKDDPAPDPATATAGRVFVRIHGDDERAAVILRELVLADVEVCAMAKVRSDLEDVYQSLGRDGVS